MAKREDDARFLNSEKLIIGAAATELRQGRTITVTGLCRRAGIFASTFYRHYHNLDDMIDACGKRLLADFKALVKQAQQQRLSKEVFFLQWGMLIYQNQDAFYLLATARKLSVPLMMLYALKPFTTAGWRSSPQRLAQIYLIYSYEVIGVWIGWAEREQFDINAMPRHAKELSFLTKTALQRLGGIA